MKQTFPLRIRVIAGAIVLVALLSGTIFYMTAIRYHQLTEIELVTNMSRHTKLAVKFWADGTPVTTIAHHLLEDSTIVAVYFYPLQGERISFIADSSYQLSETHHEFLHHHENGSESVAELGEAYGILHKEGHLLLAADEGAQGRIEVVFNTLVVNQELAKLVAFGNRVIAAAVLLVALGIFLIDRRLRNVVKRLITTANTITEGKLDVRIDIRTGDALEELSEGFNSLARSLATRRNEIQLAHDQLNRTIATQTQDLRAERDRLSLILENLPFAFILFNEKQEIIAASSAFQRMGGAIFDQEDNRKCSCKLVDGNQECVIQRAKLSETSVVGYQVRASIDDEEKVFEHSAFPIRENEKITGWLETVMDVTTRVSQHERLIRAERLSAVGEMASILAHEIRNRLTSAKLLLHIETEAENLTQTQKEHLQHAVDSIHGMEMMVEDLLSFSKPDPLRKESVAVDRLIESISARIRPIAEEAGVLVEVSNQATGGNVNLDIEKIHQAVTNLLLNAIQACDHGGITRITASWSSEQTVKNKHSTKSRESANQNEVLNVFCLEIDDSGSGIPKNELDKIFQPFYTTKPSGTGLGLATVKQVAKSHGGSIILGSSDLGGTKFTLRLPAARRL